MPRRALLQLLLARLLLAPAPALAEEALVRPGMTAEEVRLRLGPPPRACRQVLAQRYLEQWLYDAHHLRLEFDCPRGQPPKLVSVRPLGGR